MDVTRVIIVKTLHNMTNSFWTVSNFLTAKVVSLSTLLYDGFIALDQCMAPKNGGIASTATARGSNFENPVSSM